MRSEPKDRLAVEKDLLQSQTEIKVWTGVVQARGAIVLVLADILHGGISYGSGRASHKPFMRPSNNSRCRRWTTELPAAYRICACAGTINQCGRRFPPVGRLRVSAVSLSDHRVGQMRQAVDAWPAARCNREHLPRQAVRSDGVESSTADGAPESEGLRWPGGRVRPIAIAVIWRADSSSCSRHTTPRNVKPSTDR